jgi:hypothetical protein
MLLRNRTLYKHIAEVLKYLTNDGNSDTLAVKNVDGSYDFYSFDDLIGFYLDNGSPRSTAQKVSIDVKNNASITMEFRTKGKHSLFIRQEMNRGPASLRNILKNIEPKLVIFC